MGKTYSISPKTKKKAKDTGDVYVTFVHQPT